MRTGHELQKSEIDERVQQTGISEAERLANNLTPEPLADLIAFLRSLS